MANRIVPVSVSGPWIQFGGDASGAVGSANALTLRVHFDSQWEGTGKTAYFWDALRLEATQVVVALGSLVPGETDTYDVPVPGECMTQGGYAWVTFRGTSEDRVITTKAEKIPVHLAYIPDSAGNSQPITPSELDQILQHLDGLEDTLEEDRQAAESAAEQAAASAQEAAEGAEQAGNSAQSAADSAQAAGENAGAAERWSRTAESWAVGGTGTRTGEDTDNAKYYARLTRDDAQQAQEDAQEAAQAAQTAQQAAGTATASAQSAVQSQNSAAGYASSAGQSAQSAAESAQEASGSAQAAEDHAQSAEYYADLSQAAAEGIAIPAVEGVYNVILSDRVTEDQYALIVESGILKLLGVSGGLTATELELPDLTTGTGYALVVEDGTLKLQEV